MKTIEGYVFIADFLNVTPLFGRPISPELLKRGYENLFCNQLTPFDSEREMRRALKIYESIVRTNLKKTIPARLVMDLSQRSSEWENFEYRTNLVIVQKVIEAAYTDIYIYGPINDRTLKHYSGDLIAKRIDKNRLLTFKRANYRERTFELTEKARQQIQEQNDNPANIATFKLTRLKP